VALVYNPSYSGGRDQDYHSLKPVRANSLQDPILKNLSQKNWAGAVAQGEGPEFKPRYCKKTKMIKNFICKYKLIKMCKNFICKLTII
jgi:hypothetical protein